MPRSYAQTRQALCPNCGQPVDLEVWLIIDLAEHPDLADRIREGTIHATPCLHCGNVGGVDAPLLIHDSARQRVIFSPPQSTTQEQNQQFSQGLMHRLVNTFLHPHPDYLNQADSLPRETLLDLFDTDVLETALEKLARQSLEENSLLQAIQVLIEARSPADIVAAVQTHPILLTDEADARIRQGIENARQKGDDTVARLIEERYQALQQLRQSGTTLEQLAAEAIPPELRDILDELSTVSSEPELEEKLHQRPDLQGEATPSATLSHELHRIIQALGPELPPKFLDIVERISSQEELGAELEKNPGLRATLEHALGTTGGRPAVSRAMLSEGFQLDPELLEGTVPPQADDLHNQSAGAILP